MLGSSSKKSQILQALTCILNVICLHQTVIRGRGGGFGSANIVKEKRT